MNATELALAKQIAATPGFVYLDGMLRHCLSVPSWSHRSTGLRVQRFEDAKKMADYVPDLTDHATLGCLLLSMPLPMLIVGTKLSMVIVGDAQETGGKTPGEAIARAWLAAHKGPT